MPEVLEQPAAQPAADAAPAPEGAIDPTVVAAVVRAVRLCFTKMLRMETTVEKPRFRTGPHATYDVSGVIGLSGKLSGSIVVSFPCEAAINFVEAFVGTRYDQGHADFADAVGELTNLIAGAAKAGLGEGASISVPNVIIGEQHIVTHLRGVPSVIVPIKTSKGDFTVEVTVKYNP